MFHRFAFPSNRLAAGLFVPLSVVLASCQATAPGDDWAVPLTLKTFPSAYTEQVLEVADTNRDGQVTSVEWTTSGGNQRSFQVIDEDGDGVVTRTELRRIGSNAKLFEFTRRYADHNKDNKMTRREFRSASGVRVLTVPF
jgi:hypothetical protein